MMTHYPEIINNNKQTNIPRTITHPRRDWNLSAKNHNNINSHTIMLNNQSNNNDPTISTIIVNPISLIVNPI